MNALLAQLIDRGTLALAALMHAESADRPPRGAEARAWLERPDFFAPAVEAAQPEFHSATDFTFPSPIALGPDRNRQVHGRLFRAGSRLKDRPTVVLLHGWNDEPGYLLRQPALARRLTASGLHVAMLELPFHLHRRPAAPPAIRDFLSGDLANMVGATHQALAEHGALLGWLQEEGSHRIALWGCSLGGWLAGLLACHDPRVDTAVLSAPLSDIAGTVAHLPFCRSVRRSLLREPLELSPLDLSSHRPLVPPERLRVLVAEHDLFIPRPTLDALSEAWGARAFQVVPHGHMSLLASRKVLGGVHHWLRDRLIRATP